jgi:hypothetical protein
VQSYCIDLDKNTETVEYFSSGTKVLIMSEKIWFTSNISLVGLIKRNGIEAWNDHIDERMNVSWPLQELSSTQVGETFYCEGCIPLEDLSKEELSDVIDSFLATHSNSNVHIVAKSFIEIAKNYIFNALDDGMTLENNIGSELSLDELSDINMIINNELFLSAIPFQIFYEQEKDILHEIGTESPLSFDDMKNIVTKDLFEQVMSVIINEYGNELLLNLEKESMNGREWIKSLDNSMGINPAIETQHEILESVAKILIKGQF